MLTSLRPLSASVCAATWRHHRVAVRASSSAAAAPDLVRQVTFTCDTSRAPAAVDCDVLALGVYTDALTSPEFAALDQTFGGDLSSAVAETEFKAAPGSSAVARVRNANAGPKRIALVGLGAADAATPRTWRSAGSAAAAAAKTVKAQSLRFGLLAGGAPDEARQQALVTGLLVGSHTDERFKSEKKGVPLTSISLAFATASQTAVMAGQAVADGTILTRQLVAAPPNIATPTHLAAAATDIASQFGDVMKCRVLEKEECEKRGMGAFLGVAEASLEPPKFIHLTYTPPGGAAPGAPVLALVGKGLTFDSGGYNIKTGPGSMIELMKFDCGGACAVLGAAKALAQLKPKGCVVHFVIASCENMISGKGLRPGDILTSAAGKTIEVNNTDAEGRLTLADALHYAQTECGATRVIDVATLTGACMIALGNAIAGLWSPDDAMAVSMADAAVTAGEQVWRMPLEESYWEQMTSPIADMKNTGMGKGGAITAALFLHKFIEKGGKAGEPGAKAAVSWAHLDIAGPVWDDKAGATGYGAATLTHWVLAQGAAAGKK